MSMATRCTTCGTVFRVVQDQLKVSDGWVRCGRCSEVFNALESLFDLQRDAGLPDRPSERHDAGPRPAEADAPASDPHLVDRIDAALFSRGDASAPAHAPASAAAGAHASGLTVGPAGAPPVAPTFARADAAFDTPGAALAQAPPPIRADEPSDEPTFANRSDSNAQADAMHADPPLRPEFVRDAERAARWKSSRSRLVLFAGCAFLALLLAAQAAHHFRPWLAARWPETRPALVAWCAAVGCRIDAPRRIEDISVESTTLTRAPDSADAFRLAVTLRNRGTLALALPSVDLSLTDNTGRQLTRRALNANDFRAPTSVIAPGGEAALQLLLSAGTPRVTGYTVEIFYP